MQKLILHPTSTAQWHALLGEAQQACAIYLKEEIEAYLVFLLMRFIDEPAIASSTLGLEFLEGYRSPYLQDTHLKEVGDKCLLFAGLFPERAIKRRVKVSYFVKLGQFAYNILSQSRSQAFASENLFTQLGQEFTQLMDVLQATRDSKENVNLLQSLELWQETNSQLAWQRLRAGTSGLPVMLDEDKYNSIN